MFFILSRNAAASSPNTRRPAHCRMITSPETRVSILSVMQRREGPRKAMGQHRMTVLSTSQREADHRTRNWVPAVRLRVHTPHSPFSSKFFQETDCHGTSFKVVGRLIGVYACRVV